jgi:ppGpp synthetase/RelA/SpoT-type nucleotidyltranferase
LSGKFAGLLEELLRKNSIDFSHVVHRAKSVDSFQEKINRKGYQNPLDDMKDLAGVRVVTYYNSDVDLVASLIRSEFELNEDHSSNKILDLDVDEFGYRSFHLVCSLKEPRSSLLEWRQFANHWCEIQVRSVLQDAWAAISQKIDYKKSTQAPREIRRQLFRLSALLELADEEFVSIRHRTQAISKGYREEVERGDLWIPVNLDSLEEYVREYIDLGEWEKLGVAAGLANPGYSERSWRLTHFLDTIQEIGIEYISELDELICKHRKELPEILKMFSRILQAHSESMFADPIDTLHICIAFLGRRRFSESYRWKKWRPNLWVPIGKFLDLPTD